MCTDWHASARTEVKGQPSSQDGSRCPYALPTKPDPQCTNARHSDADERHNNTLKPLIFMTNRYLIHHDVQLVLAAIPKPCFQVLLLGQMQHRPKTYLGHLRNIRQ